MEQERKDQLNALKNSITALMADEAFLKQMAETGSTEEIRTLLEGQGIKATAEQIEEIVLEGHDLGEKMTKEDGELDVDVLEQVSGGGLGAGLVLGGMFLIAGAARRSGWKRTLIAAGAAFAIGCCAPTP